MKVIVKIALFCLISLSLNYSLFDKKYVDYLKKVAPFEVEDPENNKFKDWTIEEIRAMLGLKERNKQPNLRRRKEIKQSNDLPESFDFRKEHPECMLGVLDQGKCGSCWAFSAVEALQERFCLQGGEITLLSVQDQVSCDKGDQGCEGGMLDKAWHYLVNTGVVNEPCFPYTSQYGKAEKCISECKNGEPWKKYRAISFKMYSGVDQIKNEVFEHGPIQTGFDVYQDFMQYRGGIYEHVSGVKPEGKHAVVILGWGTEQNKNYWICQNSWNSDWGESGYFRIKMGEVKIDDEAYAGRADLESE